MSTAKHLRPRKCRVCSEPFQPRSSLQITCSAPCAYKYVKARRDRETKAAQLEQRRELRAARERIKSRRDHERDAQTAVNAWIRERDRDLPCISCGRFHDGQWHAGHYRSVGSHPELRFHPLNIHRQCAPCNTYKSGDLVNYRMGLLKRVGQQALDWLEGPHEPLKYSIDELKEITAEYRRKLRELRKEGANG